MSKFSIIIPVYNVAPYLRECLDSVLAQAFAEWEAICVDDGSTDESGAILDEYAAKDGRFCVIHQKNAGVSVARNVALDAARGEWVCFLDSDDVWHMEFLFDVQKVILANSSVDCIGHNPIKFWDFKSSDMPFYPSVIKCDLSGDVLATVGSRKEFHPLTWTMWDKCYKRDLIEKGHVRFAEGVNIGEDGLFSEMVLSKSRHLVVRDDIRGCKYRQRSGSLYGGRERSFLDRKKDIERVAYAIKWGRKFGTESFQDWVSRQAIQLFFLPSCFSDSQRNEYVDHLLGTKAFDEEILPYLSCLRLSKRSCFVRTFRLLPMSFRRFVLQWLNG